MLTQSKTEKRISLALLWTSLVVCDCAAQLLFKSAAVHLPQPTLALIWVAMVAQSWRVWMAVGCLLLTFGIWMLILRESKLSKAFPVTALTVVGVIAGSSLFFGETIDAIQYAGIALIVVGVALLSPLDV